MPGTIGHSGGRREGAGRPGIRGRHTDGSGKPPSAVAVKTRDIANKLISDGELTPLEYMLQVLRDVKAPKEDRMWAAEKAAPYIHPRLAAIEHSGPNGGAIQITISQSDAEL